jgi:hypothetical protein
LDPKLGSVGGANNGWTAASSAATCRITDSAVSAARAENTAILPLPRHGFRSKISSDETGGATVHERRGASMKPTFRKTRSNPTVDRDRTLTIRMATPGDVPALTRLAQRDSVTVPQPVNLLVAAIDGELRAALPLDGGAAIADPFHPTRELVTMLSARRRQLRTRRSVVARRGRRSLRPCELEA